MFEVDIKCCVRGFVGRIYVGVLDVNKVVCCLEKLIIFDLFIDRINDINIGGIKNCCKNGIIYLVIIDFKKMIVVFLMNVYKVLFGNDDVIYLKFFYEFKFGDGVNIIDGYYICGEFCLIKFIVYMDFWNSFIY